MVKYKRLIMLFMALAITIISQIIISCNNDKDEENNSIEDDMTITGVENGHEYVDLGLSVSWATCNIGAKNPYENGSYYPFYYWGIQPVKNASYDICGTVWDRSTHL